MPNNLILATAKPVRVSQVRGSLRSGRVVLPQSVVTTQGDEECGSTNGLSDLSRLSLFTLPKSLPHNCSREHCYRAWCTICPPAIVNTTFTFSISFGSKL